MRQIFIPQPNSLGVESNVSLCSGLCSEVEMGGQAVVMVSALQKKLALQSHLLLGDPLKRASNGNAIFKEIPLY